MTHLEVFQKFKSRFPEYIGENTRWSPNGKNSIRITRIKNSIRMGPDLAFTCDQNGNWRFETIGKEL